MQRKESGERVCSRCLIHTCENAKERTKGGGEKYGNELGKKEQEDPAVLSLQMLEILYTRAESMVSIFELCPRSELHNESVIRGGLVYLAVACRC